MTALRAVAAATVSACVILGCSAPTESRREVVCARPGIPSIVAEIRDAQGRPNARGATVQIRNTRGYQSTAKGFADSLLVQAGASGGNVGGTFTVEVSKPYHRSAVSSVVVPEDACGIEAPGAVSVALALLPGAPPVRQVVTPSYGYGFGYGNMTDRLPAYVEADVGISQAVTWRSRDTTVFTVSTDGVMRTRCRATNGEAWAIAHAVADSTKRDSLRIGVFADTDPARCPRA